MALVSLPHHNARNRLVYKIKINPEDNFDLSQRNNAKNSYSLKYVDVLALMLYVDMQHETDFPSLFRKLFYALAQTHTPEEIKEILKSEDSGVCGENGDFFDGEGEACGKYYNLVSSILDTSEVSGKLVGDLYLFENEDDLKQYLIEPIKNKVRSSNSNGSDNESKSSVQKEEQEYTENQTDSIDEGQVVYQSKQAKEMVSEIIGDLESMNAKPATLSFIRNVVAASANPPKNTQEDISNYICTMLHGLGLMIPQITEEQIKEMLEIINRFISARGDAILQSQIEHFEAER